MYFKITLLNYSPTLLNFFTFVDSPSLYAFVVRRRAGYLSNIL